VADVLPGALSGAMKLLAAAAAGCAVLAVLMALASGPGVGVAGRLVFLAGEGPLARAGGTAGARLGRPRPGAAAARRWLAGVRAGLPEGVRERLGPEDPEIRAALAASGLDPVDVHVFGAVAALLAGLAVLLPEVVRGGWPPGWLLALVVAAGAVGPRVWMRAVASRYRAAVAPEVADLLTLGAESGLGLLDSMRLAAGLSRGVVGRALETALGEIDAGREVSSALRETGRRLGGQAAGSFTAAVVQGLELGSPVARVLRTQAETLRTRRRQALESEIAALSLKLTLVTILLFLPALFVLSVLPNLLSFLQGRW